MATLRPQDSKVDLAQRGEAGFEREIRSDLKGENSATKQKRRR